MAIRGYVGQRDEWLYVIAQLQAEADAKDKRVEEKPQAIHENYGEVGAYDPVLRAHCRLDREG